MFVFTLSRSTASTLAQPVTVHLRVTVTGDVLAGTTSFGASIPSSGSASYVATVQATIPAGADSKTLLFDTDDDSRIGSPGTVTLEVLRPAYATYATGASRRDTVTVLDNDAAQTVTIQAIDASIIEGEQALFSVQRSDDAGTLVAAFRVELAGDYVDPAAPVAVTHGASIPVNFTAGQTAVSFTVPTVDDLMDENRGAVNLSLEVPNDTSYLLGDPSRAVVAVVDNDFAAVIIATTAVQVTEGESVAFTATRIGLASDALGFTVRATFPDRIGTPNTVLQEVVFGRSRSTVEFSVLVRAYSNYRTDAVLQVEVVVAAGTNYQVPASATPIRIPIRDVDIPTVRIEPVLASVSESRQCAWFRLVHSNTDGFIGSDLHFVDVLIDATVEGDFLAGAARQTVRMSRRH